MKRFEILSGWGRAAASGLLLALLAACSVEPTYKRPEVDTPTAFKEAPVAASGTSAASAASGASGASGASAQDTGTWKTAQPADDAHRGEWWKIFGDPQLDALEERGGCRESGPESGGGACAAGACGHDVRRSPTGSRSSTRASARRANGRRRPRNSSRIASGGTTGTIWRAAGRRARMRRICSGVSVRM